MKIFLIGLPGSGKTELGRRLSKSINLPFIDLDEVLEKQEGLKISKIFSEKGKDYFRTIEAEALRKESNQHEFVMATGGGTPCFHDNMTFINQNGTSIFLDTPVDKIAQRLDPEQRLQRPLLGGAEDEEVKDRLQKLYDNRINFYRQAHHTISRETVTAWEVLQLIYTKK